MVYNKGLVNHFIIFEFIIIICLMFHTTAYAENSSEISLVDLSKEEAEQRLNAAVPRRVSEELLDHQSISVLMVTDDWIAVGNDNRVFGVFNLDGTCRYCIAFSGEFRYALYYDQEKDGLIVLLFGNAYYTFDNTGNLIQMEKRDSGNTSYERYVPDNKDKYGNEYYLGNGNRAIDFLTQSNSKIMKRDKNGPETVFWDSQYEGLIPNTILGLILIFVILVLLSRGDFINKFFGDKKDLFHVK